ncbi:TetR/AcrR family transcriptional regulator [Treponema sp. OMZ 788]|uniref:TetR/AcrR family transcriptional regulator n=1 Tax=Treponema sp. OMZ 788 TaxID=2563664 RepID=UPI0020A4576D|nr:TetR/AcrR family transcriptional regulator [Treponema sp. OMZ 788]UTC64019.1 TetR/AcrR family transcriptional regulator [Treponema sp. OMZ 788]
MCAKERLPADVRKKEIREAAKKVFLKKGFDSTTMEDVIAATGMSKGGVYRHYKSTAEMLYDLMLDGNEYRSYLSEDFMRKHEGISVEDLAIEIAVMKMLDPNEYKSLYAMFLMEAEKNKKLQKLRDELIKNSTKELRSFLQEHNLDKLIPLTSETGIAFLNAVIVSCEVLSVGKVFLKNKDFFRNIIRHYFSELEEKHNEPDKKIHQ